MTRPVTSCLSLPPPLHPQTQPHRAPHVTRSPPGVDPRGLLFLMSEVPLYRRVQVAFQDGGRVLPPQLYGTHVLSVEVYDM